MDTEKRQGILNTEEGIKLKKLNRPIPANSHYRRYGSTKIIKHTGEGWLYLETILDLFSRKIGGWVMENTLESCLVEQAFNMAVLNRKQVEGLLHHTDRGSQYADGNYRELLTTYHIRVSMSNSGDCYSNAPMESFFSTLKCEQIYFRDYIIRAEAKTDIFACIKGFYNRTHLHSSLGYRSPEEFEQGYHDNLSLLTVHFFR